MHDTLHFWLDRGVDGFRADVVHLIGKGDVIESLDGDPRSPILEIDTEDGHLRLQRIRDLLDGYEHQPMMVGEVYLLDDGQSASYLGDPVSGEHELHLAFDFRPIHSAWGAAVLAPTIDRMQREFAEPGWPTWVWSNHDQPRHRTRFGSEERARLAAVIALTVRGTPFLYAGEELGLTDADVPADRVVDPNDRDGCRAPIPWTSEGDDERGHGWEVDPDVEPSGRPWLPFPTNASTHAADQQVGVEGSMFELYRELLALRRATPTLRRGAMSEVRRDGDVVAFDRSLDGEVVTVIANLGDDAAVAPPETLDGEVLVSTHAEPLAGGRLAGCEATVVRRR
jgi:alpha-glucosidase